MKNKNENKGGSIFEKIFSGRGFYVTLAAITLAVGLITYFGIKASFDPKNPDTNVPPATDTEVPNIDLKPHGPTVKDPTITNPDPKPSDPTDDPKTDPVIQPVIPTVEYSLPVSGVVTKDFSGEALVFSSTMGDYRAHTGIDITAADGAEVLAAADGVIKDAYHDDMRGVCVEIAHEDGVVSVYANLKPVLADGAVKGARVKAGDVIGYVGNTALLEVGEPSHLHFETIKDDDYIDPTSLLPKFEAK